MKSRLSILLTLLYYLATACSVDQESAAGAYKKTLQDQNNGPVRTESVGGGDATAESSDDETADAGDEAAAEKPADEVVDPAAQEAARIAALVAQAKPIYDATCGIAGCHNAAAMTTLNSQTVAAASAGFDQLAAVHAGANVQKPSNEIFEGLIEYLKNPN